MRGAPLELWGCDDLSWLELIEQGRVDSSKNSSGVETCPCWSCDNSFGLETRLGGSDGVETHPGSIIADAKALRRVYTYIQSAEASTSC